MAASARWNGGERTRISDLARGVVRLELVGAYPAAVLNAAAAAEVELWDAESAGENVLRLCSYERHLETLSRFAERSGCDLSILDRRGGRFGLRHVLRRPGLVIGAALAVMLLFVSSLFVWEIDVRGLDELSRGEVLRALEDSGFTVGCFWPGLQTEQLESEVMLRLPQIGWMAVNVSGSRAVVVVRERQEKPLIYDPADPCDLVAARSGLIRRVNVLAGQPLVRPGEIVTEGETLVTGALEDLLGGVRSVRARGAVMAETWYEISAVHPKTEERKTPKGLRRSRFALILGKRRLNLYISSGKAIDGCDKIISEYTLGAGELFSLPIRVVREQLVPYENSPAPDYDPALTARRLYAMLESRTEGQILSHSFTPGQEGELYVLTLRAHCTENIARPEEK